MDNPELSLAINGREIVIRAAVHETLLAVLRDRGFVGAKEGCGIGMCGACTVLIDGRPISSCLLLAAQAQGKAITTVEGLPNDAELHPVQQAFVDEAGFQCAYCTPGFILTAVALLTDNLDIDDSTIRDFLSGNLCRCGSYENIISAVKAAAAMIRS